MQKYEQIFYNQLNFMSTNAKMMFYATQFDEIKPAIQRTIKFINEYDWGEHKELILMNCIAVLPFMLTNLNDNPTVENKQRYKQSLIFLKFIKHNKGMANHHIFKTTLNKKDGSSISFDDFYGFDLEKLDEQIDIFEKLASIKIKPRRKWFSGEIIQLNYLCHNLKSVYGSQESKILQFLGDLFKEFDCTVDDDVIKQKILKRAQNDSFVRFKISGI